MVYRLQNCTLMASPHQHVNYMVIIIVIIKSPSKWNREKLMGGGLCGCIMAPSNENIFRVTGPLCGEFTGPGEFPAQRPVTRSCDVFFDLRPNKRLNKQPWGWWFKTPSWSLWRQWNVVSRDLFWDSFFWYTLQLFILIYKFIASTNTAASAVQRLPGSLNPFMAVFGNHAYGIPNNIFHTKIHMNCWFPYEISYDFFFSIEMSLYQQFLWHLVEIST